MQLIEYSMVKFMIFTSEKKKRFLPEVVLITVSGKILKVIELSFFHLLFIDLSFLQIFKLAFKSSIISILNVSQNYFHFSKYQYTIFFH